VYVSAKEDGSDPRLRIIDWQSAARDFDTTGLSPIQGTTGLSPIQGTTLPGRHSGDAEVYLAPETDTPYADPADLDVFGLGVLAYAILTGQPPATSRAVLIGRLETEWGLHPLAVSDSLPQALDALVFDATRADVNERLESAEAFLELLDHQERAAAQVQQPAPSVDRWPSRSRRRSTVLKVALDEGNAARPVAEARALDLVGGGAVVRFPEIGFDGPVTHVPVEGALREAGCRLEYDPVHHRFRASTPVGPYPSRTSTSLAFPAVALAGVAQPQDVASAKLDAGVQQSGFLALTLRGRYLPGTCPVPLQPSRCA
jgi:hypothetical protein